MKRVCGIVFLITAASAWGQNWPVAPVFGFQSSASAADNEEYRNGLRELDARQWEQAAASFAAAAKAQRNADAALYWRAYAQSRAGHAEAALLTIAQLQREYAASRWLKDARALELELRSRAGVRISPASVSDDDLKLMAVNSLMQSDPDAAFPVVQTVLASGNSDRIKEQALFVLAQSESSEANRLLNDIANGRKDPGLQIKAIRLIGMTGSDEARKMLADIYRGSSNLAVKRAILQSALHADARKLLLTAAKSESNPELRHDAIRLLAMTGAGDHLWQLYNASTSVDDKKTILQSMSLMSSDSPRLLEIAKHDNNPELRAAAVQAFLVNGQSSDALVSIFESDSNSQVRDAVLNVLMIHQNGKALVELARREKDPKVKAEIVQRMAIIHSPDVTNYMMELLR